MLPGGWEGPPNRDYPLAASAAVHTDHSRRLSGAEFKVRLFADPVGHQTAALSVEMGRITADLTFELA